MTRHTRRRGNACCGLLATRSLFSPSIRTAHQHLRTAHQNLRTAHQHLLGPRLTCTALDSLGPSSSSISMLILTSCVVFNVRGEHTNFTRINLSRGSGLRPFKNPPYGGSTSHPNRWCPILTSGTPQHRKKKHKIAAQLPLSPCPNVVCS